MNKLLELNEKALKDMKAEKKKLTVIPGATGKLGEVARLASGWFRCFFLIEEHSHQ